MIQKLHKLDTINEIDFLEFMGQIFQEQGLLLEMFYSKPVMNKKLLTARFKLGFETQVFLNKDEKEVVVYAGNENLGIESTVAYRVKFNKIRTDSKKHTFEDLGLDMLFCKVMRKANLKKNEVEKV